LEYFAIAESTVQKKLKFSKKSNSTQRTSRLFSFRSVCSADFLRYGDGIFFCEFAVCADDLMRLPWSVSVRTKCLQDEIFGFALDEMKSTHSPSRRISPNEVGFHRSRRFHPPARVDFVEKSTDKVDAFFCLWATKKIFSAVLRMNSNPCINHGESRVYHQFRRNCISSKRSFVYHHCEKKCSLRLMIYTFGDEMHACA